MKMLYFVLISGSFLAWLDSSLGNAKEQVPTVDSFLAKWEEASQKCKTLDAKLTVWTYDRVFGDNQPTITQGRFYYELPNLGRYDIRETAKGATNDWSSISEAVIWSGNETLWIDGPSRRCTKFSAAKIQAFLSQPVTTKSGWLSEFVRRFQGPEQMLPLMIGIHAIEVQKPFDVTLKRISDKEVYLRAVPRQPADKTWYREIGVIVNAKSYMTVATQAVSPDGNQRTVIELSDTKVNQRPIDRDPLLAPGLSGLQVTEEESTPALVMTLFRVGNSTHCFPQRMLLTSVKGEYVDLDALSRHPDRKPWVENGYAIVVVGGKYGFADVKGKLSIRPQFEYAENFSDGRAVVQAAGRYGYIDTAGQMIIKPQFEWAYAFRNGLGAVLLGKKWGVVNPKGVWIKEPTYKRLDPLVGGILAVTFDGKQGFIDEHGEIKNRQPETK